jgi:hypothetical protein
MLITSFGEIKAFHKAAVRTISQMINCAKKGVGIRLRQIKSLHFTKTDSQHNRQINKNEVQNKIRTQYWLLPNKNCQVWPINRDN